MQPSNYQQAIYDAITHTNDSLLIQACAGSGKTTTIVEAAKLLQSEDIAVFLAFNKSIAVELGKRLPATVSAMTFHSLAYGAIVSAWTGGSRNYKRFDLRPYKTRDILRYLDRNSAIEPDDIDLYGEGVIKLVSLGKNAGIGFILPDTRDEWLTLIDHYDVRFEGDDLDHALEIVQMVNNESKNQLRDAANNNGKYTIDFDDQLYYAAKDKRVKLGPYNTIFVDESQDTNAIQRELLKKMKAPDGRIIAVGDRHQSLYGFRGADSAAMDLIKSEFHCRELPLSVSYRCPQNVVLEAQKYISGIEAWEQASEGSVERWKSWNLSQFRSTDAIICRNNGPIVGLAYKLAAFGIGCQIIGRDFGKGLISLIKKLKADNLADLSTKLDYWQQREINAAIAKNQDSKVEQIEDKANSIRVILEEMREGATISDLLDSINGLFEDRDNVVTLSSVHRFKGREADRVFFLDRHLVPSKYAKQDWQIEQEQNILYVAITRAKDTLVYINSDDRS